ncbi:MAG: phosphatase PAP2 family protein, partial [candidate division KSB1 bacterium]|nr:phosphatase PAP2 family protein [candidate division KSB1 bacterium]
FLFMPMVSLTLFLRKKYQQNFAALALGTGVHLTNFLLFLIFPVLAPFMTDTISSLSTRSYSGYLFYFITQITQAKGAQAGGTFPSVHVSAALAWALAAWRYERKLGYILLPTSLGIGISAAYLGHHHAMDVIAGYLWAGLAFPMILFLLNKRGEELSAASKS